MSARLPVAVAKPKHQGILSVGFAQSIAEVREAQRLRYDIFARELGAQLHNTLPGLDYDPFDPYCEHLLVRDSATGQIVGYSRVLTDTQASRAGGFYSQTEFDLEPILNLPGRFAEVGRTCIHPDYRNGATITALWSGLANFVTEHSVDYFIGCPSIPLGPGYSTAHAIFALLAPCYLLEEPLRVKPRLPLPPPTVPIKAVKPGLPPLLKAYLRVGAKIGGEPHWDADFQVADLFILLPTRAVDPRYARHFLGQVTC